MNIFHLFLLKKLPGYASVMDNRLYGIVKRMIPALSFALMIFLPQTLSSQNYRWVYVTTGANRSVFYIDKTSIKKAGAIVTIWEKNIFFDGSYHIVLSEWDCVQKRTRINIVNVYAPSGDLIGRQNPTNWSEITPDSVAEGFYLKLCKNSDFSLADNTDVGSLRVISQQANIRELPSMESTIVKKVRKGSILRLVDNKSNNGWYQIYLTEDKTAWIHGNTVEFVKPSNSKQNKDKLPSELLDSIDSVQ